VTFIDLFAGSGGFRLGLGSRAKCVYACEIDPFCQKTYRANFKVDHPLDGDIRLVDETKIPDHDLLVAGFPCTSFSIGAYGTNHSLKRTDGFENQKVGTLFFDVVRILKAKQPSVFLLENVKNLLGHEYGDTFRVVQETLEGLGYYLDYRVIDACAWVPQHRERVYIVGCRTPFGEDETVHDFLFPWDSMAHPKHPPILKSILHPEDGSEPTEPPYTDAQGKVDPKYIIGDGTWAFHQRHRAKHQALGHNFGYSIVGPEDVARTLSARYHKDGSEILIRRNGVPRRLTPREAFRLMGYPNDFKIVVSDTQAYRQAGNAVVPLVIRALSDRLIALA